MAAVQAARSGGEYFAAPEAGPQRRYEALRAYLLDGEPAATVARRFGYTTTGLYSAVRDFRANRGGGLAVQQVGPQRLVPPLRARFRGCEVLPTGPGRPDGRHRGLRGIR